MASCVNTMQSPGKKGDTGHTTKYTCLSSLGLRLSTYP